MFGAHLLMFTFILFILVTFPPTNSYWNRLVSAGVAYWVANVLFGALII